MSVLKAGIKLKGKKRREAENAAHPLTTTRERERLFEDLSSTTRKKARKLRKCISTRILSQGESMFLSE